MATSTHFRTCNLCEAMCGMKLTVEDGRITDVRGDPDDVFSRGHICPKGPAMREVLEDPDRIRHPMRRTASGWERVSWDEALDEAAAKLKAVRAAHGGNALGFYVGNPSVHNHGAVLGVPGFSRALGTKNRFDANSQDANPKLFACMMVYGDSFAITIPDVDRTDHLLVFGANPAASNGSVMSLGDVRGRLSGIRERGGKIVLFDPRRTESAALADEHHFLRPGGDAALLLALHHVLFAEKLVDERAVGEIAGGLDTLRALAAKFPPQRVAAATGIDAETIARIARDFAKAKRAVAYGRVGPCQNEFSSVASWLIETLNVVTGNFDREGGAMFATPALDLPSIGRMLVGNGYARWRSRVRGLPEFGGQLPAAVMAEEMETPGEGQIRAFVTLAGNPVLSTANGERLASALAKLDYMVAIDYYLNETTRHAHLILPPVHALEHPHYDVVLHALAVRNTAKLSPTVIEPEAGGRDDWSILYELGMRLGGMGFGNPVVDGAARTAWRLGLTLSSERLIDLLLRAGPYGSVLPWKKGISLARLREAPHGIDLGPLVPARGKRVRTSDGKVELAPKVIVEDLPRVEAWIDRSGDELLLIGRRHLRSNNSWMHNVRSLTKGPDRATLLMNPADAAQRGVAAGQTVRVRSRVGEVSARVEATDEIMVGVVSLPHGFGHAAAKETMAIAGALPGPNVNAITDDNFVEPLTGTAILNGVVVQVEAV
jgi:anaerobic selenocysteine-containing dehydrogenase